MNPQPSNIRHKALGAGVRVLISLVFDRSTRHKNGSCVRTRIPHARTNLIAANTRPLLAPAQNPWGCNLPKPRLQGSCCTNTARAKILNPAAKVEYPLPTQQTPKPPTAPAVSPENSATETESSPGHRHRLQLIFPTNITRGRSAKINSCFKPTSTANFINSAVGEKLFGPSSQRNPSPVAVVIFPPTRP